MFGFSREKIGGKHLSIHKLRDLIDSASQCGLTDLKSTGKGRSWHNNSQGNKRIYGKLDRALCNNKWIDLLPESFVEHRNISSSDHTPMILHLLPLTNTGPMPFRFFNHWIHCQGYKELAAEVCSV